MEVTSISQGLAKFYEEFIAFFPNPFGNYINLLLLVLLISIYAVFIWKFYRFIAHRDIISLNLNQYNKTENPALAKFFAGIFYLLEYIIILPFIIFFWFAIFTLFLLFLTEGLEISQILLISAIIIATIRMVSYYEEDLAKDIAKLFPLTLLAIAVTKAGFFSIEKIITHISNIPDLFGEIFSYLFFIIVLEIILRFFDFVFSIFDIRQEDVKKEGKS